MPWLLSKMASSMLRSEWVWHSSSPLLCSVESGDVTISYKKTVMPILKAGHLKVFITHKLAFRSDQFAIICSIAVFTEQLSSNTGIVYSYIHNFNYFISTPIMYVHICMYIPGSC